MTVLMMVLAVGLGFGLHWGWLRFRSEKKLRLPARWLLNARGLVTTEELEVWKWLRQAFSDHVVMVKVPVMRFTVPSTKDQPANKKQHWHELLNGVYCTFTVSNLDGKVVGCVDVPGKRGLPRAQREMKEGLLQECGIGYTTVRGNSLPAGSAMRTAFLGEPAPVVGQDNEDTRGGDSSFHNALNEFTTEKMRAAKDAAIKALREKEVPETDSRVKNRDVGFNPDGTGSFLTREKSRYPVQFEDSFTMSNESRPAKLS